MAINKRTSNSCYLGTSKAEATLTEGLAHRLDLSVSYISLLETQNRQPSLTVLAALANEFGLSLAQFAEEIERQ